MFAYIVLCAIIFAVVYVLLVKHHGMHAAKVYLLVTITFLLTTVMVGACAYRTGTACGAFDAAMPLEKCLSNPRG